MLIYPLFDLLFIIIIIDINSMYKLVHTRFAHTIIVICSIRITPGEGGK